MAVWADTLGISAKARSNVEGEGTNEERRMLRAQDNDVYIITNTSAKIKRVEYSVQYQDNTSMTLHPHLAQGPFFLVDASNSILFRVGRVSDPWV
jgi:hypothetical protein